MRFLTGLLLIGIVYGATFGSAHNHGSVSRGVDQNTSLNIAGQATAAATIPLKDGSKPDGCLICLFHRQLFSSVVHHPVFAFTHSNNVVVPPTAAFYYHPDQIASDPITRQSGRAPPRASQAR